MKRNKNKWNKKIKYCNKCRGFKTKGGIKHNLFGFIPIKITTFRHECRCVRYEGQTELDKEKCDEVLKEQKEQKNDNK